VELALDERSQLLPLHAAVVQYWYFVDVDIRAAGLLVVARDEIRGAGLCASFQPFASRLLLLLGQEHSREQDYLQMIRWLKRSMHTESECVTPRFFQLSTRTRRNCSERSK
jgi:hypothetical protein